MTQFVQVSLLGNICDLFLMIPLHSLTSYRSLSYSVAETCAHTSYIHCVCHSAQTVKVSISCSRITCM